MINILPPELKNQVEFSKRNSVLMKYLVVTVLSVAAVGAVLLVSLWYSNRQLHSLQETLLSRQTERKSYQDTEARVQSLQSTLNLIDKLLTEKTQYSAVLADLAAVLPKGSYISNTTLTGDDKKPLKIIIFADSINTAGLVRNALLTSDRIKSADIQSITRDDENNVFAVDIIAAFKEGQAR